MASSPPLGTPLKSVEPRPHQARGVPVAGDAGSAGSCFGVISSVAGPAPARAGQGDVQGAPREPPEGDRVWERGFMLQSSAGERPRLEAQSCLCPLSSLGLPEQGRPCVAHTLVRGVWVLG